MDSAEDTSIAALVQVITGLQTELSAVREDAARQREEDRKEMARLVKMIEGLTRQLDAMLGEMRQAEKAELARTRAEAQAIAAYPLSLPPLPSPPRRVTCPTEVLTDGHTHSGGRAAPPRCAVARH